MRGREALALALFAFAVGCGGSNAQIGSIGVIARREPTSGRVVVIDVPTGLAGDQAGLKVGDVVVAVDGVPVTQMSAREFSRTVRGEVGSHVKLTVERDGAELQLDVVRQALKTQ